MSDRTQYFRKFPITIYNDVPALNICRRVDFNNKVKDFFTAFYSFNTQTGEKIETISHDYYGDVDLDWLIYHTNDIVDPYHDVGLDYDDFENTIKKKYGSIRLAKLKTAVYRNNYRGDESVLSTDGYAALDGDRKKYWSPQFGPTGLVGYTRNTDEMYASTNRIMSFSFTSTVSKTFTKGEIIKDTADRYSATVASANTSYVTFQHIEGGWDAGSNFSVTGDESKVTIEFNYTTRKVLQDVIPIDEQVYFSKYSFYDLEDDANEARRNIFLIEDSYTETINQQLDELMK